MSGELKPCKNCEFPIRENVCCKCGIWQDVDYSVPFEQRFKEQS